MRFSIASSSRARTGSRALALLLAVAALAGCVTTTGKYFYEPQPAGPGKAALYVYRIQSSFHKLLPTGINLDGEHLVDLKNGSYVRVVLSPGQHTVSAREFFSPFATPDVVVEAEPGGVYYVRYATELSEVVFTGSTLVPVGSEHFEQVDETYALKEIRFLSEVSLPQK